MQQKKVERKFLCRSTRLEKGYNSTDEFFLNIYYFEGSFMEQLCFPNSQILADGRRKLKIPRAPQEPDSPFCDYTFGFPHSKPKKQVNFFFDFFFYVFRKISTK
jgi:hypothetical protein